MSKKDNKFKKSLRELAEKAEIHPMLSTKYNALERKKLREFEQSLFPTEEDKRKLAEAVEPSEKTYKVLKNLRPNIEYAEFLRDVASKIEVLENPISSEMVEQIKELSKSAIKQGKEEKIEFENNKQEICLRAMKVTMQKYQEER